MRKINDTTLIHRRSRLAKGARALAFASVLAIAAVLGANTGPARADTPDAAKVLQTYGDIAHAGYEDALMTANALQKAVEVFLSDPTADTLAAARTAWLAARVPYMQTEAYRFGNSIVDDWEGKVNAWPLDEGLIDYVDQGYGKDSDENALYTANVIANTSIKIGGKTVDTSNITKELIADTLHEAGEVEANVATGYHAVEFLLWGQDLNGTGPGAGAREASDFDTGNCTNGNCDRRGDYLRAATELLIDDLTWMAAQWEKGGEARKKLADSGITAIVTGMGSLSYGELAGERMKLGLMVHDPEEEHDCFSDNTHNSHFYDAMGIRNVYLGKYKRIDGTMVEGPSVSDMVEAKDGDADKELRKSLDQTMDAMGAMVKRAEGGEAYDQMIGEGNEAGNKVVQAVIDALLVQTRNIERAVAALKLKPVAFEGSDSLDSPEKVKSQ